ncbi:outer membrane channel protein TolC [Thalassomonas viridans]|uniref:Outer membrane channel protein TolC n=1 Tax=Thalassomonas viridans TaxID=137584 RepID=A0AAE9Z0Z8_9GAMM|nr:outer membrane channel protein TolC [Thalassomonas viridans]WDE04222.1 outer membrane channel protein TolC [Thalassomonas viridans]
MKKTITSLLIGLACAASSANVFADDLLTVYQQALENDPVVLRAEAQFNIAKEDIEQARATLLPSLSATGSLGEGKTESISQTTGRISHSDTRSTSYGASLNMEIYHHDSWLRLDRSKKSAHRSDLAYQIAKQDLIVRVTEAYFNLLSAKDDLEFATAEKIAIERQLEQTKQRFSVGLTAITDVHEAQAQYDNAVTSEIRAENNIYTAEEALRVITNVYPRDINILNTERFSTSRPLPDSANEWQQTAEAKSLDLISQKIALDIAKEDISIAKAGHLPTLDFSGNYSNGKTKNNVTDITGPYLDSHSIGITLNVPIYSGGAISSSVRQAQHSYVSASQDLASVHRGVVQDTRNAYNTVIAAISAIKSLEQALVSAEKALEATEAGFEVGTRTIVDVLNSTRNLYDAKRNLSTTRYSYIQSVLNLKRAGGTITEQDINDINSGLTVAKK